MSDRQRVTPPQTRMWPSPPCLSLSISSVVSPAATVVSTPGRGRSRCAGRDRTRRRRSCPSSGGSTTTPAGSPTSRYRARSLLGRRRPRPLARERARGRNAPAPFGRPPGRHSGQARFPPGRRLQVLAGGLGCSVERQVHQMRRELVQPLDAEHVHGRLGRLGRSVQLHDRRAVHRHHRPAEARYVLRAIVDPSHWFTESNTSNNSASATIQINTDSVRILSRSGGA